MDGLNFRKYFGIQNLKKQVMKPDHGACCVCQACGYEYDECKCQDNALIEMAEYVELLEAEIASFKEKYSFLTAPDLKTCDETKGNYGDNPLLALYDEVIQQCMILEVVGRHIGLSQIETSQMYKGLCPFHQDHKPSFWVNTESQRFECVSCGESGDVVDFMMKCTEMSEKTALLILANEAGIDPEDFLGKQEVQ